MDFAGAILAEVFRSVQHGKPRRLDKAVDCVMPSIQIGAELDQILKTCAALLNAK